MEQSPNIIFINPPNAPFTSTGILIEPIDLLGLASWSNHTGHECTILDMDVKGILAENLNQHIKVWPKFVVVVFDYHIPLHNGGAIEQVRQICKQAKMNGSITILGGKAATFWDKDKLKEIGADIFIKHEMELALKEIFDLSQNFTKPFNDEFLSLMSKVNGISYLNKDDVISNNPNRQEKIELTDLPISNRKLVDLEDYIDVRTLLSSRGCHLKCSFCHVPGFWGWWRGRTAEQVVDEIEILVNEHNAQKILFLDDNATVKTQRMKEISQLIQQRNIKTTLGCLGTIDKYNPEMLEHMHKGGFRWIHYGAESGDNEQLTTMGKRITSDKIRQAVKGTQNIGLRVRTSWILDMPDLTIDALKRTEELILEQGSEEIRLHFLTLRLGSILHNERKHIETEQFIHNPSQNINLSRVTSEMIIESTERIIKNLIKQGYTVVRHAHEFKDVERLQRINPKLKIVSLCPLRYGLGWKL